MDHSNDFWLQAIEAARLAVAAEATENLSYAILKSVRPKHLKVEFGFISPPSEDDLEALSLIETTLISSLWRSLEEVSYEWILQSKLPRNLNLGDEVVFHKPKIE